jgi:hypothetical protein
MAVKFELDAKQMAAFRKRVERWKAAPLKKRIEMGTLKAADYMVRPMKSMAPVKSGSGGAGKRGEVRASIRAQKSRQTSLAAIVRPNSPISHLAISGTRPHSLASRRPGASPFARFGDGQVRRTDVLHHPGGRPNPFVQQAAEAHSADAFRVVSDILFKG